MSNFAAVFHTLTLFQVFMQQQLDFRNDTPAALFRKLFLPTLLGMLSLCVVTAADGVFIGRGVGPEVVAAVNIVWAPMMVMIGFGLMMGVGCSVVASIKLGRDDVEGARRCVWHALVFSSVVTTVAVAAMMASPTSTGRLLGSDDGLMPMVVDYMVWFAPVLVLNMWSLIGLFAVRLDGSPRFAMWCNVLPGLLNIFLDWLFVFPLDMGLKGAAIATAIAVATGAFMAAGYLFLKADFLRISLSMLSAAGLRGCLRNVVYEMRIGVSAFLGEATMAMVMFTGNLVFMHYMGTDGVAAFGVACYYCPFFFMIGNAIAQSAQPIISYNFGIGRWDRIKTTERIAIITALCFGAAVLLMFVSIPDVMTGLFLDPHVAAARYAIEGLPIFAACVIFFIFNVTAIGYFQSVEAVKPSVWFALCRGVLFLVPSFVLMPIVAGNTGIWLAVAVSELATTLCILTYYLRGGVSHE